MGVWFSKRRSVRLSALEARNRVYVLQCIVLREDTELGKKFREHAKNAKTEETIMFMDAVKTATNPRDTSGIFETYIVDRAPLQINVAGPDYVSCINKFRSGERDVRVLFSKIYDACKKDMFGSNNFSSFQRNDVVLKHVSSYDRAVRVHAFFSEVEAKHIMHLVKEKELRNMLRFCTAMYNYLRKKTKPQKIFSNFLTKNSPFPLPVDMLLNQSLANSLFADELIRDRFVLCSLRLSEYCVIYEEIKSRTIG